MIVSRNSEKPRKQEDIKRDLTSSRRSSRRVSLDSNSFDKTPQRTHVQHNYEDHLFDPIIQSGPVLTIKGKKKPLLNDASSNVAFPERLHRMLEQTAEEGEDSVVSWQPHGRCFVIHRREDFVNEVMPRYFQQSKLTSFQRQLNLYGFIRLTVGKDRGGYYHPYFLRFRVDLCSMIVRTRIKGNGIKAASSPETEPNFYKMEYAGSGVAATHATVTTPLPRPLSQPIPRIVSSKDTEFASSNTSLCSLLKKANVVSPPNSPHSSQRESLPLVPPISSIHWVDSSNSLFPHSGDSMEFEGQTFRYLEHDDMLAYLDSEYYESIAGKSIEGV